MSKTIVDLTFARNDLTLIVKSPTGIFYTNQIGGNACLHPEIEGFAVPLHANYALISRLFNITKNRFNLTTRDEAESVRRSLDHILERLPDEESVLANTGLTLRTDLDNLHQSGEGWLHVIISNAPGPGVYNTDLGKPVYGFGNYASGVLAWENSN